MLPPDSTATSWDRSWLAALTVIKAARRVFRPGNRPPGELIPLVEPMLRLQEALRARDALGARRAATDLTSDRDLIAWGCQPSQPQDVRNFASSLEWLARALRD